MVGCLLVWVVFFCIPAISAERDEAWAHSATSLTFQEPDEMLKGENLHAFLAKFHVANWRKSALHYTLGGVLRAGRIRINGADYPVEIIDDKWAGKTLVVHGQRITIELATGSFE